MSANPESEPVEGEVWVREGEMYALDREKLFALTGAVAIFPYDGEVYAFIQGRGRVPLSEILKSKPKLEAVR